MGPKLFLYVGTLKTLHTPSAAHLSCSISCASVAVMRMGTKLRPSPRTATLPAESPENVLSQQSLGFCAVSSEIAPGALRLPPGSACLPRDAVLSRRTDSHGVEGRPPATIGDMPTSRW